VLYMAALAVVAATWLFLNPPDAGSAKRAKRSVAKTVTTTKASLYTQEDYKAKFSPVNLTARDAFKPLIARTDRALEAPEGPSGIPPALAGGVAGWTYTGTVEVDGVVQAVLENPTTGEGEFVKVGDSWKTARVMSITPTDIILSGPSGTAKTVRLQGTGQPLASGTLAPASVGPLRGPIGPLTVRPERRNQPGQATAAEGNSDAN
jgi:hypothetical protein